MDKAETQEYFWGVSLTKEAPEQKWSFQEEEEEDSDYCLHTLFLRTAVLGASAVKGELNIVQAETEVFEKKELKQPILSLRNGTQETVLVDLSFSGTRPTTFRLIEGTGPVYLSGQHLVEVPHDGDRTADESEFFGEEIDDEEESEDLEEETATKGKKKQQKRKASKTTKKGKMEETSEDEEEEEEEDEEDEEEMDDDDEEEEETPEKKKKAKGAAKKAKPKAKGAAVKRPTKKAKK